MKTLIMCAAILALVLCAGQLSADKATSTVTEMMAGKLGGLLARSAGTSGAVTSKTPAKPARKETALDISAGDFGPAKRRSEMQPVEVGRSANKTGKSYRSAQYQEDEDDAEVASEPDEPSPGRRPLKASMRNVGYTNDAKGNRIYDDGTVTNQTGDVFYHYGSAVKYE